MGFNYNPSVGHRTYTARRKTEQATNKILAVLCKEDMPEYYRLQHEFLVDAIKEGIVAPIHRARALQTLAHLETMARKSLIGAL